MLDVLYYWIAVSLVSIPIIYVTGGVVVLLAGMAIHDLTNGDHEVYRLRKLIWSKSGCEFLSKYEGGELLFLLGLVSAVWTVAAVLGGYLSYGNPLPVVLNAAEVITPAVPYLMLIPAYILGRLSIKTGYKKFKHLKIKLEKL